MARIPSIALLAPVETRRRVRAAASRMQLDFRIEADNNRRFRENFTGDPDVIFPAAGRRAVLASAC